MIILYVLAHWRMSKEKNKANYILHILDNGGIKHDKI